VGAAEMIDIDDALREQLRLTDIQPEYAKHSVTREA